MHTVESAREEATRLRLEAEDYCDQKLASFEIVLDRLLKTSQAGRKKLAGQSILTGDISMNTDLGTSVQGRSSLDLTQADEFFDQEA